MAHPFASRRANITRSPLSAGHTIKRFRRRLGQLFGPASPEPSATGQAGPRVLFETMEPRLLLSADLIPVTVDMNQDGDDLQILFDGPAGAERLIVSRAGEDPGEPEVLLEQELSRVESLMVRGSDGDDRLTVDQPVPFSLDITFDGGLGEDTLVGSDRTNTWEITGAGTGSLNSLNFSGTERLEGGDLADEFFLQDEGFLSGGLDGGAGEDTLSGPSSDSIWTIDGAGSGSLAGTTFSALENLTGSAGNEDVFVLEGEGSLAGLIHGGDAGFDTLEMNGDFTDVVYTATGPDSGRFDLDGNLIDFAGLEPTSVGSSGLANLTVDIETQNTGSQPVDDQIRLMKSLSNPGQMVILSENGTFELLNVTVPTASLTIEAGQGDDSFRIDPLDPGAGWELTIDGGTGTDTLIVSRNSDLQISNTQIDLGPDESFVLADVDRLEFTGGPDTDTVDTSNFDGSVFYVKSGFPTWQEEGPGGISGDGTLAKPVTGAINAIAAHPEKAAVLFIGSVNGGVWRTTNGGGNWQPLTDDYESLAIGSLALSPLDNTGAALTSATADDNLVLYAGTGQFSSSNSGGEPIGVLFSSDGGSSWTTLGETELSGLRITKVQPTTLTTGGGAHVVYVSTLDVNVDGTSGLDDRGGLFRLEVNMDGSYNLIKQSGAAGLGLSVGHFTDIAFDPGLGTAAKPATVYAVNPWEGVYKWEVGDANWTTINTNIAVGADADASGYDDFFDPITNGKLALSPSSGAVHETVYVAFLGGNIGVGPNPATVSGTGLTNIFKISNDSTAWSSVALPFSLDRAYTDTNNNGQIDLAESVQFSTGLHPGGQGDLHFSIGVDPNNPDMIYVGGDRTTVLDASDFNSNGNTSDVFDLNGDGTNDVFEFGNNAVGITSWIAGRLFRFDPGAGSWTQIVGSNANGTAPHADSRAIVFDASGNVMLEADDGGIYQLTDPSDTDGSVVTQWTSLAGDLRISESNSVAYDPLSGQVIVGTQDNGSAQQSPQAHDGVDNDINLVIDELGERLSGWTAIHGGDGANQAVITIDSNTDGVDDQTLRFSYSNNFNFLYQETFDASGNSVVAQARVPLANTPGGTRLSGLAQANGGNPLDASFSGFTEIPLVVNRFDDTRMVTGLYGLYESSDRLQTINNVDLGMTQARVNNGDGTRSFAWNQRITSVVYGGKTGGTENNDLIIANRGGNLVLRQAAGNPFTTVKGPTGQLIQDITVDPENWKTVYVADGSGVFKSSDITAASPNWFRIGNAVGGAAALEYVPDTDTDILLVGGNDGVLRMPDPDTLTSATAASVRWQGFGLGLPNAPVTELYYHDLDDTDADGDPDGNGNVSDPDKIIVSTKGRGVWSIDNLDAQAIEEFIPQFVGSDGDDHFKVILNEANASIVDVFDMVLDSENPIFSASVDSIDSLVFLGRAGNDKLTVSHENGAVGLAEGLYFDGGSDVGGDDVIELLGDDLDDKFEGTIDGKEYYDLYDTEGKRQLILYTGVEEVDDDQFLGWGNPINSIRMGLYWLAELLGLKDEPLPVFGSTLQEALKGTQAEERPPKGDPARAPSVPMTERVLEETQTDSILDRLLQTGNNGFNIGEIGKSIGNNADFGLAGQELADALNALDGTSVVYTNEYTGDPLDAANYLEWALNIDRTLSGRSSLDMDFEALGGSIDIDGSIDVSADVALDIVFGVDEEGFYIKTRDADGAAPVEFLVDNFQVNPSDDVRASGRLGFLDVYLKDVDLDVHAEAGVEVDVTSGGSLEKLRVTHLFSNGFDLFDVDLAFDGDAATSDLELTGTFGVSALLPFGADDALEIGELKVDMAWPHLNDLTAVQVEATPGFAGGQELLKFLNLQPQDFISQLSSLRDQLEQIRTLLDDDSPFGLNVPFAEERLGDLIDIVDTFDDKLLQPLTNDAQGGAPIFRSVQELARNLTDTLGVDLEDLNLGFADGELTYDIAFYRSLINASKDLGMAFDLDEGLADLNVNAQGDIGADIAFAFTLGADLSGLAAGGEVGDNIFVRERVSESNPAETDPFFSAALNLSISDFTADARFGFLQVTAENGELSAAPSFEVSLGDPNADGRTTINEFVDAFPGDIGDILSTTVGGAGSATVQLAADFAGLQIEASTDTQVDIVISDFALPDQIDVTLPDLGGVFDDFLNFNNMDAASFVALLGQLATSLDEIRDSDFIKNFDIPFVSGALDSILEFGDMVSDSLLFDDGDDDKDGANRLVTDLNKALADAGLGEMIRAQAAGGRISLVARDTGISAFDITVIGADAGGLAELGFVSGASAVTTGFRLALESGGDAPTDGIMTTGDLGFRIAITRDGQTTNTDVVLAKTDTDDNVAVGNDLPKLLTVDNAPNFSTTDELALLLPEVLGLDPSLVNSTYDASTQVLTYDIVLGHAFLDQDLPLDFDLDLGPLLDIETDGLMRISSDAGFTTTIGVYLGPADPSEAIDGSTALDELNNGDGVEIKSAPSVMSRGILGRLSDDASFDLAVNGAAPVTVIVPSAGTQTNWTVDDLAVDINHALVAAGLAAQVQAQAANGRIELLGQGGVTRLELTASGGDPATGEIGLQTSMLADTDTDPNLDPPPLL
ncbi:MAG: LEPR-XLL domain-containing protein, partial [Gammaproteobacteria bacterium]|nr:LEPR-XLL domain-containing protein [Gammaproteobacteria bacterium]